ncbi:MAG: helix-turn-helix transcriptional regulator [Parcubacteria group bacterium]|jgi:putative transcriptional regulator
MHNQKIIKNIVRMERRRRRVTQAEMAEAVGVSRQTVVLLEKGNYAPSLLLALKVSQYLHEPIEKLFYVE